MHWGKITTATGSNSLLSSFAMEMMNSPVLMTSLDRLSLIWEQSNSTPTIYKSCQIATQIGDIGLSRVQPMGLVGDILDGRRTIRDNLDSPQCVHDDLPIFVSFLHCLG